MALGGAEGSESGEGSLARASFAKKSAEERSAPCLACHRGVLTVHWDGTAHAERLVSCIDCHRIHPAGQPVRGLPARADEIETCVGCHLAVKTTLWRSSHHPLREGRMLCSSCHAPHGSTGEALLRRATVNETCLDCHADKRGPFVWVHAPVAENCLNCHVAHGSLHDALLVMKPPRLCQTCHLEPLHVSDPHSSTRDGKFLPDRFVFDRGCDNCHMVHGSNSPSGPTLLR